MSPIRAIDAAGEAWTFAYVPTVARSASQRPVPYLRLGQIYEPVSANSPALSYGYDSRGLVSSAQDATSLQWGTRGAYAWRLALGERGQRIDPAGGAYTVYYSTDGDPVRHIDEIGREVDSVWDGRHRVTQRTFPEGDHERFAYDAKDNVTSLTKVPKPGSPLANLVITATYDSSWNKLASIVDPMGNETDFTYYPNAGACGSTGVANSMMCKAQRPAVSGTRPTFTYQYNSSGLVTQSVDPAGITTKHAYDPFGNMTSTTEGAAAVGSNPALNLVTSFTPDAYGNVLTTLDPRGNAVTATWDVMRRKLTETSRNGGATALPLTQKRWIYDLNGRPVEEDRATGFDGSGNPTGWQAWLTAYTPTGKTWRTTDPLGHAATTAYDALDRVLFVTDPAGLVTGRTWDLAGQQLSETRGVGTPQQQNYAAFTYWPDGENKSVTDANSNTINLAYDDFNRIASITHPDSTTELSAYDPNGDLTIWTNRGGFSVVRCYDVLSRKVSEAGITGATNTGSCPTGGTSNLTTRSWDMQTGSFGYDLAGRLTSASNANLAITWAYDAAGRPITRGGTQTGAWGWDAAGNMTSVTYAEGSVFTYSYDALNRTGAALQGATTLASLGYDPLGRRTTLSFNDGSSQTWGYDAADRVTSLSHSFPTSSDNVTLTYGYDNAGREISKTTSNTAYVWSPAVATTAYAAANALNQYPSVTPPGQAAFAYTWWPEGPLKQSEAFFGNYDELNRVAVLYPIPTPGTVDPTNYVLNGYDALGHLASHQRHPPASAPCPTFTHATDGLRPETVLDGQTGGTGACGTGSFQGYRRFVLGPDPDERWAFLDFDGTTSYPHTDREGSTIALSRSGSAILKLAYDAYGNSNATFTETGPGATSYAFRYTGQPLDGGTSLYDYKARLYSPGLGRFLQPDPVGLDQGPNLFEYVGDDPVDRGDPSGMASDCTGSNIGCGGGLAPGAPGTITEGPAAGTANLHKQSAQVGSGFSNLSPNRSLEQQKADFANPQINGGPESRQQILTGIFAIPTVGIFFGELVISLPELATTAFARTTYRDVEEVGVKQGPRYARGKLREDILARGRQPNGQVRCAYCGRITSNPHADHVVPYSKGGATVPENLELSCPSCNLSKGSKYLGTEWTPPSP